MLVEFFQYNWQVRNEWLEWCKQLPDEELRKQRIGGVGTILQTFLHIIDVEYSWTRAIQDKEDIYFTFSDYSTIEDVQRLSETCQNEIAAFLQSGNGNKRDMVKPSWIENAAFTKEEILHHIIAHEIHHIGQLSIWAREMGLKPVSANVIFRGLF
jgi:uncharacterized damage-inducible protein DinB